MRVLITGGTGLLGHALIATADGKDRLSVLHLRDYTVPLINGAEQFVVDIRERPRLADFFARSHFDVVIHAAGIANVDYVECHPEEGWQSNVIGTQNVVDLVRKQDIKLVYISSNAVFDGKSAPYRESDPTNPINRYGCIKVECEHIVKQGCPEATIVRPILMYGWHAPEGRTNPATWIIDRLRRGEQIHLVTDVYENPLWSYHCAVAIWRLIQLGKTGTWHIAGKDIVNRYEFGKLVAQAFGLDPSLLHPVKSSFFPTIAPRPCNTSFVTDRMQGELGVEPLSVLDGLARMRAMAHSLNSSSRQPGR